MPTLNLGYQIVKSFFSGFTWNVENASCIYLTFDDGPHPTITPWVLDQLKDHGAKATFFVVGENAEKYPELVSRIKAEGHSLGNHTYRHLKGWSVDSETYLADVAKCEAILGEKRLFRPPYGRINMNSISSLHDYNIVMWDVLSKDYLANLDQDKALRRICKDTALGSIVVFHDSEKAEENLRFLLPKFLAHMTTKNLRSEAL